MAHAEASARTVAAAVAAAAAQLGLRSDQVDFEVLEEPVSATFGFVGSPARVRVTSRTDAAVAPIAPDTQSSSTLTDSTHPTGLSNDPAPATGDAAPPPPQAVASPDASSHFGPASSVEGRAPSAGQDTEDGQILISESVSSSPGAVAAPASNRSEAATAEIPGAAGERGSSTEAAASPVSPASPGSSASALATGAPDQGPSRPARSPRRTDKERDEPIEPQMVEEDTERAGDFLEGLLDAMDVDGDITTWIDAVGGHIDLEGSDLDTLVGANGETLDALQELTRLAVLRQSKRRVRLLIDINGFRSRQREQLTSVVKAAAEQVIKTGDVHEFQPMTPAERKIVHDAVAAIDGVRTESLGEDPNRRVVIQPE